jgi:hypothetical protein
MIGQSGRDCESSRARIQGGGTQGGSDAYVLTPQEWRSLHIGTWRRMTHCPRVCSSGDHSAATFAPAAGWPCRSARQQLSRVPIYSIAHSAK